MYLTHNLLSFIIIFNTGKEVINKSMSFYYSEVAEA